MGATIYFEELTKLSELIITYEAQWNAIYDDMQTQINNFAVTEHLTGAGAETMKSYMSEVHTFMLGQLKAYINELKVNYMTYAATYMLMDMDAYAILDISTLEKCGTDFLGYKTYCDTEIAKIDTAVANITDVYTLPFFIRDDFTGDLDTVSTRATTLKESVVSHEYAQTPNATTSAEYLDTITQAFNTISEGGKVTLDDYQPGSIDDIEFYEALHERKAVAEAYAAVNADLYDAYTEVAKPYIDYVNAVEDRVPNAINNFLTGTTCFVAAVSVCVASYGTALPVAATILCGAFGVSEYTEGVNNLILYYQQDGTAVAFNPIRDTVFQGDQTKYNIAMSIVTTVPGMFTGGISAAVKDPDTYIEGVELVYDIYGEMKDGAEGGGSDEFDSYSDLIPGDFSIDWIDDLMTVTSFVDDNQEFLEGSYQEMEEAVLQMQNGENPDEVMAQTQQDIQQLFYEEYSEPLFGPQ